MKGEYHKAESVENCIESEFGCLRWRYSARLLGRLHGTAGPLANGQNSMNDVANASPARSYASYVGWLGAVTTMGGVGAAAGTSSSSSPSSLASGAEHRAGFGLRSAVTSTETSGHPESGLPGRGRSNSAPPAVGAANVARPAASMPALPATATMSRPFRMRPWCPPRRPLPH